MNLNRKEFLTLLGGLAISSKFPLVGSLEAQSLNANGRTLINLLLEGGPDFRHLLVPRPNNDTRSYGYKYWNNRTTAIGKGTATNNFNSWQNVYNSAYEEISLSGFTFGVLRDSNGSVNQGRQANGWLRTQIKNGNVAIICNVEHSETRDHAQSLLVLQSGSYATQSNSNDAGGWGGRLISQIPGRLISFSPQIRPFANTTNKAKILSFNNSRNWGILQPSALNGRLDPQDRTLRALNAEYSVRTGNFGNSIFERFANQQQKIQALTQQIRTVLPPPAQGQSMSSLYPTAINNLFTGSGRLQNQNFANQIRSLYDAFQVAGSNLLNMKIASLNYGGWDSHKNQANDIEPQYDDIFGTGKGFDSLFGNNTNLFNNCTIAISGEFGRQLKSNGDNGTDHGRANYILLIGGKVRGGVYGDMFPVIESTEDSTGRSLYDNFNRDIEGRTSFDKVFGPVCDWLGGSGAGVFSNIIGSTNDIVESSAIATALQSANLFRP